MAPAFKDPDDALLKAAKSENLLKEKITWPKLKVYLNGAKVDISARTPTDWMASFEKCRRDNELKAQAETEALLEAAKSEDSPGEMDWDLLQVYLEGAEVDITVHTEEEWMALFDNARRMVREGSPADSRLRSASTASTGSEGETDTDSGYHSDAAQDKTDERKWLYLITQNNASSCKLQPLQYHRDDKISENRISQIICDRYKLQPDMDGSLTLKFRYKGRRKPFLRKCVIVSGGGGVPDLVFGQEPPKPVKKAKDHLPEIQNQGACGSRDASPTRSNSGNLQGNIEDDEIAILQTIAHTYALSGPVKDISVVDNEEVFTTLGRKITLTVRGAREALATLRPGP